MMGQPSTATFVEALKSNGLSNCPVTPANVEAAEQIFRPDIGSLKGKTTQSNPPIVDSPITSVPASILKQYRNVTLCIDIMYVNRDQYQGTLSLQQLKQCQATKQPYL